MPTLDWIGKKSVVNHHNQVPFHLLKEVPELSVGSPDEGNLIVEGDNLVALKALLPYYAGQVKCIYIDPPYNTGNENWIYNDNVNSPEIRRWLGKVVGGEMEDLSRHDKWLCMMYPRISLLREMLRDDGMIFVSIDDNEIQSLRFILDDIFGKDNFIAQFIWNTEGHTDNQFHVKINHEYIVLYARCQNKLSLGYVVDPNTREGSNLWAGFAENSITKNGPGNPPSKVLLPVGFPSEEKDFWLKKSEFPKGLLEDMKSSKLTSNQLKAKHGKIQFPLRLDEMHVKENQLIQSCSLFSGWANANKLRKFILAGCKPIPDEDGMLLSFYLSNKGVVYYRKERGDRSRNIVSVLRNLGTTEKMRSELEGMGIHFGYPKPKELVSYIVKVGSENGDLILDSFAGSGTTGHALLKMNKEDGGKRRCILVEMDPKISQDVTTERLRRVCKGYKKPNGETVEGLGGGFRYCKLGPSVFGADGRINPEVTFPELARHVFFTETGRPIPKQAKAESPLIGIHQDKAVYLLYNGILKDKRPAGGNVLTQSVLDDLPKHDGAKVVYGTACRFSSSRLKREKITFKQIPYEIRIR